MSDFFSNREHVLSELRNIDLSVINKEIEGYNDQFGMGRMMGKAILQGIGSQEQGLSKEGQEEDRKTFLDRINQMYGIYLEKTGISLEPVEGSSIVFTGKQKIESSVLRMNLTDRNRFLEYISALEPQTVTESQISGLKNVLNSLTQQLRSEYDVEKLDPRAVEFLGSLEQITASCEQLDPNNNYGLAEQSKKLAVYMEAAKGSYIKEYILTSRTTALADMGKDFGPSVWHKDSNEESYQQMWNKMLDLLVKVKKNPRAMALAFEITENLRKSAEHAKQEITSLTEQDSKYWPETRKENYLKILNDIIAKIKPERAN